MFSNLKLFRDIAAARSVSRGAALNRISQSAASQSIAELERHLEIRLLDRTTRPLVVTEAGRLYLDLAKDVLRRQEDFDAAIERLRRTIEGTVRIAAIYSVGLSEMSELEKRFSDRLPGSAVHVEYLRPERVYEAVIDDRVDLGLVSYPGPNRELTVLPWRSEEMVVVASPHHSLAGRARCEPGDLRGLDFVGFDEDLPIERAIAGYLEEHGVRVRVVMRFDNLQMIKEAVMQRAGLSILPARVIQQELVQGRLAAIPFAERSLFRPVGIIHRKRKRLNRAGQVFLEMLRESPPPVLVGIE